MDGDAHFCPSCGQQILRPGAPPPPPTGPEGERPLAAISVNLKKGMLSSKPYILVLTPQRFIFAVFDNKRYQSFIQQQRMEAKERGDGFFKKIGNAMMSGFQFLDHYLTLPPQGILAENAANFFVPLGEVEWLRYQKKERQNYDSDSSTSTSTTTINIILRAGGNEFKMSVNYPGSREGEYLQHFRQLLGARFRLG